jgi:hypothetical protein
MELRGYGQCPLPYGAVSQIVLVPVEGVLALSDDLRSAQPSKWARGLYSAMHAQYRMCALSWDASLAKWWLKKEMMPDWAMVLSCEGFWEDWKENVVREFLANSWEIAWFIDKDRDVLNSVQRLGVNTLRIEEAIHRPGFKPEDQEYTPWETIASDTLPSGS